MTEVNPGSGEGDVQVHDVIIEIGEFALFSERIDSHLPPGDEVNVTVLRFQPGELEKLLMSAGRLQAVCLAVCNVAPPQAIRRLSGAALGVRPAADARTPGHAP